MKEKTLREGAAFTDGFLAACQNLLDGFDQPTIARELLRDSGIGFDELMRSQRSSGFMDLRMEDLTREATCSRKS